MTENNEDTSANINLKWLENIYNKLMELEQCLALAQDGFNSMPELVQIATISLPEIQCRNFPRITTIFISLLDDAAPVISKEYYEDTRKLLDMIRKLIDAKPDYYFDYILNQSAKAGQRSHRTPNKEFYVTIDMLVKKRAEIIVELREILYLVEKEKDRKGLSQ